jgi:glutamine cyclotransferase
VPRSRERPITAPAVAALVACLVSVVAACGGGDDAVAPAAPTPSTATTIASGSAGAGPEAAAGTSSTASASPMETSAPGQGAQPGATGPPDTAPARAPAASSRPLAQGDGGPAALGLTVVGRYPHDPAAFTQGLLISDGRLFESTGLNGASSVREVDVATGHVLRRADLGDEYFGEGLAAVGDRLVQLTWRSGLAFVFDRDSFAPVGQFRYDGEGWGLCDDGSRLVMSDGTPRLTFRDRTTFAALGQVEVTDGGAPVDELNELECVGGKVLANVWHSDRIARIDPATGRVDGWLDAASLRPAGAGAEDVLNGIAYDPASDTYLLTGKRWPSLYRVRIG